MKPLDEVFPEINDLVPARVTPRPPRWQAEYQLAYIRNHYARNQAAAQWPIDTGKLFLCPRS